jgi:hypothetical protein
MKHIAFAVIAAAALAVIGPRISQGHPQPKEAAASQELFAPSDYRTAPSRGPAAPEPPTLHFKR